MDAIKTTPSPNREYGWSCSILNASHSTLVPSLWPTYIDEKEKTLSKPYEIKVCHH
jgi:hypothetical protein